MKILVAADGSPYTKRMLAYLAAHEVWLNAAHQYTVFNAVQPVPSGASQFVERGTLQAYYADTAEAVFKPARAFFKKHGVEATFTFKVGPAADLIAKLADQGGFDMVMMGTHGHGVLGNFVMGSVVNKVAAQCGTPLLMVR